VPDVMGTAVPDHLWRWGARTHTPKRHRVAFLRDDVRRAWLLCVDDARRNCTTHTSEHQPDDTAQLIYSVMVYLEARKIVTKIV